MRLSAHLSPLVLAILSLPILSVAANGQTAGKPPVSNRTLTFDVVVETKGAKHMEPVTGLQQTDFTVLDNKAPRALTSFRAVTGPQAQERAVILLDALNVTIVGLNYERNQVVSFLRSNGGKLAHPTAVAVLTDKGVQTQEGFSTDGNSIADSLQKQDIGMRNLRRDTGFWGAEQRFEISLNGLRALAAHEAAFRGRTAILWVSPGWPLLSGPEVELTSKESTALFNNIVSLSTQLREDRVSLYAIDPIGATESVGRTFYYESFLKGVSKPSQVDPGNLSLQVLAVQSGGLALNENDTPALLQRCYVDMDSFYEIQFDMPPTEKPDVFHELQVKLPGAIARTRNGYYAQP